jgi:ubiquinone/menaquinone biosynthesis C-methylase UbiE
MPQLNTESDRVRRVYQGYADAGLRESKWSLRNRGNLTIHREIASVLADLLAGAGIRSLNDRRTLEIGCGEGRVLDKLIALGANPRLIAGIDLLEERIEAARRRLPEADLRVADARSLPYPDESFHVVVAFTVFSSILDLEIARQVAGEMCRVLKPGGVVVHYDFQYNNPWNPNVRGVKRAEVEGYFDGFRGDWKRQHYKAESRKQPGEIKERIHGPRKAEIKPEIDGFDGGWKRLTLFPPLARRLGVLTPVLYPVLAALPLLRTHLMGVMVKPGTPSTDH